MNSEAEPALDTLDQPASVAPSEGQCRDCGAPVIGPFCQSCGQRHGPAVQPFGQLLQEAAADLGSPDGRVLRTLQALFLRPGLLTEEYLAGRHTRYLPPFRLYLVCSVVYFTLFFAVGSNRFFFLWVGGEDPQLETFLQRLPQAMFVLLPLFAAMLAVLYRRSGRLYTAHVVFALHFHAFAFLALTVAVAVQPHAQRMAASGTVDALGVGAALLGGMAELSVLVYLYLALHRSYRGSRLTTVAKTSVLMVGHATVMATVALLTVPPLRRAVWEAVTGR